MFKYLAGFLGFSAVALGAIGSHALKLEAATQHSFELATRYQLIHALLMLYFAQQNGKWPRIIGTSLIICGCVFFCGGIYLKSFTGNPMWTSLAPIGGVSFMLSWLSVVLSGLPNKLRL